MSQDQKSARFTNTQHARHRATAAKPSNWSSVQASEEIKYDMYVLDRNLIKFNVAR